MKNPHVSFDSIDLMNDFITAGMNNLVAEKVAQRMAQAKQVIIHEICERDKNFATKEDIMMIAVDTKNLQTENKILESNLSARISEVESSLSARISEVECRLDARISEVEFRLDARISEVESNLSARIMVLDMKIDDVFKRTIIWVGGIMMTCTGSIIAMFLKFMH